ncbi:MAG TPA: alpha/beta fold hydrolase, partial [Flavisolibacter sp.]|nr:alpha/beta fold hydrolase [Flavisolibacter sp.]
MKHLRHRLPKYAAVITLLFLAFTVNAQTHTPRYNTINGNCGGYYEYLPQGYNTSQNYPLIVYIHGVGESGNGTTDLGKIINCWTSLPRVIENGAFPTSFNVGGQNFSFIIISPQFMGWPTASDVNDVINYAVKNYRVDQSRIYVTGMSMGGGTTWDFAAAYPTRAAAVVPVCGASTPDYPRAQAIANAKLAVWATHNLNDYMVSSNNTIAWVSYINQYGGIAKSTIWPYTGHDAWSTTYAPSFTENGMNIYQWMLQY